MTFKKLPILTRNELKGMMNDVYGAYPTKEHLKDCIEDINQTFMKEGAMTFEERTHFALLHHVPSYLNDSDFRYLTFYIQVLANQENVFVDKPETLPIGTLLLHKKQTFPLSFEMITAVHKDRYTINNSDHYILFIDMKKYYVYTSINKEDSK